MTISILVQDLGHFSDTEDFRTVNEMEALRDREAS